MNNNVDVQNFRVIRKPWIVIVMALWCSCLMLSAATPSFMSPDETDHIKRAYGLWHGNLVLDTPPNQNSGGLVDSGLLEYINFFYLTFMKDRNHKLSAAEIDSASAVHWSGEKVFSPAPGTGYYFPLIYGPQAVGLGIGEIFGLSIDMSYKLARLMAMTTALVILACAFILYEPPLISVALLMIPMTLFQMFSTSIDGLSNALAVLAVSIFLKIYNDRENAKDWLMSALGLTLVILVSSRPHLLPMLIFPFMAFTATKRKNALIIGFFTATAVALWLITAITHTVDTRVVTGAPTSTIAAYYISHPSKFLEVFYKTLTTPGVLSYYGSAFIGNLGWLDTTFSPRGYMITTVFLGLISLWTLGIANLRKLNTVRVMLIACAFSSTALIFFALLVTYNPHPAFFIQGVQGRYFLVPALLLSYASVSSQSTTGLLTRRLGYLILALFLAYNSYTTLKLLIHKYYIQEGSLSTVSLPARAVHTVP